MYVLLLLLLALVMLVAYILSQDIVSPVIIMCAAWFVCSVIAFSFEDQWGMSVGFQATILIIFSVISFLIGQMFSKLYWQSNRIKQRKKSNVIREVVLPSQTNIGIQVFLLAVVAINFFFKYKYSIGAGNVSGVSLMLKYIRAADEATLPTYASLLLRISNVFGVVYTFLMCRQIVLCGKSGKKYVIGFIARVLNGWLTGGRTWLIHLVCEIFIYSIFMYRSKYGWKKKGNLKIIVLGGISFCAFLFAFPRLGLLIGKGVGRDPAEMIGYYAGSSIALFSNWLENSVNSVCYKQFIGENTLFGLYNFIRVFGFDYPVYETPLEFTYIPHFYSNIYTALRRYIQDYGIGGMLIIEMILGSFYGAIYEKLKSTKNTGGLLLFYGMIFYPIAEHPIEERFLCKVLTMSSIFEIIMAIIVINAILRRKRI